MMWCAAQMQMLSKFTTCVIDPMQQVWLSWSAVVSWPSVCLLTSLQLICEYFPFLFLTTQKWHAACCKRKIKFIMWILHLPGNVFLSATGIEMLCMHSWQIAVNWTQNGSCMKITTSSNTFRGAAESKSSAQYEFMLKRKTKAWSILLTSSRKNAQENF